MFLPTGLYRGPDLEGKPIYRIMIILLKEAAYGKERLALDKALCSVLEIRRIRKVSIAT